jgi:tripartite-type tricarboxylate transporter receptor subunit TctC
LRVAPGGRPARKSYPSRVIKLVVPFTPGSPNDVMARLLTQHLAPRLGQPIVIDNKPGGGTTIGTKAAPAPSRRLHAAVHQLGDRDRPAMKGIAYDPLKDSRRSRP